MDDKKKAIDALRKGKRDGRDKIKQDVADSMPQSTSRERMVAANASHLVPQLGLTADEKEIYMSIATHLEMSGMLATVDVVPLTMLSQSMMLYKQAKSLINGVEDAMSPVGTNGAMTPSAAYLVMKTERQAVMNIFKDLGLDPKTRLKLWSDIARLSENNDDDASDPIFE